MNRRNWSRGETILALALYCKTPFGKIYSGNPQIRELAGKIGRTPSALSMKMCNFGRYDPELSARGISGLSHGGKLDKTIWDEYYQDMASLYQDAERIQGEGNSILSEVEQQEVDIPYGEAVNANSVVRKGQAFFRSTVLSAYNYTCCITGIDLSRLLQASHIKSWKDSDPKTERNNPTNGLCLNALHHKAFDEGYITIDTDYKIVISKDIRDRCTEEVYHDYFLRYEGKQINMPHRFLPSVKMIEYHNSVLHW